MWCGRAEAGRDHVVVENRHEPTTIRLKTWVDERYKLRLYFERGYGELFDLREDPGEINNLWNAPECAALKAELMQKLLFVGMGKEQLWMQRVAGA